MLPYLTPELWSKVLEKLPYGDIHGLITSDDPDLAIMPKAGWNIESIDITKPSDLALLPPRDLLFGVKTLKAMCWDDNEEDYIASLPGNPSAIPCPDLPIDSTLGPNIEILIEVLSRIPNVREVRSVGFGGTGLADVHLFNTGPRNSKESMYPDDLCAKMKALCDLAKNHTDYAIDKYSSCVRDVIKAMCSGYLSGKIPDHIDLTWEGDGWFKDAAILVCDADDDNGPTNHCASCSKLCECLPFRMLFSVAKSKNEIDELCLDKDSIIAAICKRSGGRDFMRLPSHITEVIEEMVYNHYPFSVDVACTKGGGPIVPSQDGTYKHKKWTYAKPPKPDSYCAHAFVIPTEKLELMVDLKKKYGSSIDADCLVDMFYKSLEESLKSFGALSYAIDTLCGKPFIVQSTVDALREGLGVTLPADKFVVLPDGAIISKGLPAVDYMYPEGYWQYCDWKGDPPESEDEDEY